MPQSQTKTQHIEQQLMVPGACDRGMKKIPGDKNSYGLKSQRQPSFRHSMIKETPYREEVQHLAEWCSHDNLSWNMETLWTQHAWGEGGELPSSWVFTSRLTSAGPQAPPIRWEGRGGTSFPQEAETGSTSTTSSDKSFWSIPPVDSQLTYCSSGLVKAAEWVIGTTPSHRDWLYRKVRPTHPGHFLLYIPSEKRYEILHEI